MAARRTGEEGTTAAALIPPHPTLPHLAAVAAGCRACHLWERATQTVFGEGPASATLMLVGEQPGDVEDRAGRPFVGPAGRLLDKSLVEAGLDRASAYVTNTVKHFKWEAHGSRRVGRSLVVSEVAACRPWLEAEIAVLRPRAIMCLGAVAARVILGKDFRLTEHRGEIVDPSWAPLVMATLHPSALLRVPDPEQRRLAVAQFVADLAKIAGALRSSQAA
jgi:uracil-DNA glycosylase